MGRQIWLGPILGSNREALIQRCSELVSNDSDSFLYLAASRPLLEVVTERLLDGVLNRGVWGTLPVYLFRGLVRLLLASGIETHTGLPLAPRTQIDEESTPLKRSLLSRIVKRLSKQGRLRAIGPLATREGCINSLSSLVGEIQRAGKTPAEFAGIIESRALDLADDAAVESQNVPTPEATRPLIARQSDFDHDVALVYAEYVEALNRHALTDADADQLRALHLLRGELDGVAVMVPWLSRIQLLVLDGFFDFTPVQGEMLRLLIPAVPDVIVNLNRDDRNPDIFRPFEQTFDQLQSISEFDVVSFRSTVQIPEPLAQLQTRLFNQSLDPPLHPPEETAPIAPVPITFLQCADRITEIKTIARQIKRLVLTEAFELSDIAVVVRELASYAETITRALDEESIPCALQRRKPVSEIPAVRAAMKLLQILRDRDRDDRGGPKVGELGDLIKSRYLALSPAELTILAQRFEMGHRSLFRAGDLPSKLEWIGGWDVDEIENVIAYVGSELRVQSWLARADRLARLTGTSGAQDAVQLDEDLELESLDGAEDPAEGAFVETGTNPDRPSRDVHHLRRKPARDVHPAAIAWVALLIEHVAKHLNTVPPEGEATRLRDALYSLLERLDFAARVNADGGFYSASRTSFQRLALDLRGLDGLRRAVAAGVRSIQIADGPQIATVSLASFLDEVVRCLRAQTLAVERGDQNGLAVLEATDLRGLRFRAIFIAGLIEGGFPLRSGRDWIYPHEQRERLKQYGLTLEDISPDILLKEEHYFYQVACRATERLYLTRPLVLEDGSETVSSYYIDEIRHAIAPAILNDETIRRDFDGRDLFESSSPSELAVSLIRQQERHLHRLNRDGLLQREIIEQMIAWSLANGHITNSALERVAIERERAGPLFGRFDGRITNQQIAPMTGRIYGPDHVFSASELSLYGKCPFKFFAQRILKLEPRGEAALDLSALDAGKLLHEVLRRFFSKYRGKRLRSFDRAELLEELRRAADHVFDEHERQVPPLNPQVWKLDREIRKIVLEQLLEYELSVQEKTREADLRPTFFELAFGMTTEEADPSSVDGFVTFERRRNDNANERVLIRGQIDRVDVAVDQTAVAYDYKLSRGAAVEDMKAGRDLQLHVYLAALEQIFLPDSRIAGGGYYILRGNERGRNRGIYRESMSAYTAIGATVLANLDDPEWTELRAEMEKRIWEFIDGLRSGRFDVNPSAPTQSCPICDYSAVCRYERFRIEQKTLDEYRTGA